VTLGIIVTLGSIHVLENVAHPKFDL